MQKKNIALITLLSTAALSIPLSGLSAQQADHNSADALRQGFNEPPQSARPRVWWHWMNGNISKDGIKKDLEWMARSGIGGLQNFDVNLGTPQIVDKRLVFMHPEWKDAFRFSAETAERLNLEMAIASSPGWSETGGPWVRPEEGLKKIVWAEMAIKGGGRFVGKLPQPPANTGPYLDLPFSDPLVDTATGNRREEPPQHYQDIAVLAYPAGKVDRHEAPISANVNGQAIDPSPLIDDSLQTGVDVSVRDEPGDRAAIVTLNYRRPQTMRTAKVLVPGTSSLFQGSLFDFHLESSSDGTHWTAIRGIPATKVPTTVSFAPVTARHFRLVMRPAAGKPLPIGAPAAGVDLSALSSIFPATPKVHKLAVFRLSGEPKVDQFESKAGFAIARDYYGLSAGVQDEQGIDPARIVDITARMRPDGTLDWTPPAGNWRVVRLGWSLLGTTNHPAPAEATGLEVDKYDGGAVRRYLEHYLGMYRDAAGDDLIGRRGVRALLTDSIEVGAANWTPRMSEQFKRLRGYDPMPYLPALTGVVVGSRQASDKFLYDYRRTLADLLASEHYGTVATVAHENSMLVYGEALEGGRPMLGDDMAMRAHADFPMAAMWTYPHTGQPDNGRVADMKGAASVAHIYGQNIVGAESMTSFASPWAFAPKDLRRVIDFEFLNGVNRPVIHTSVHQPVDDKIPGLSLSIFGQYFNRHETWADMAKPWVDYMARTAFMLQQGRDFADIAYFHGEEGPITALFGERGVDDVPSGYAYDFANSDALLNQLTVDHGELVSKSGARYRLLYLGGSSRYMTHQMLRRVAELVKAGAIVVGEAPIASPSLIDHQPEFAKLVGQLWGKETVTEVGAGKVIAGSDVQSALTLLRVLPDFTYSKPAPDSSVLFTHRRLDDGDVYFVNNRLARAEKIEARFRVVDKEPEIWRADSGRMEPVSYRIEDGQTVVPLSFDPEESFFVVFRKPARAPNRTIAAPSFAKPQLLDGTWSVAFQNKRGAPASVSMSRLNPLNENADSGIKYFSGLVSYSTNFQAPAGYRSGKPMMLNLGSVGDVAEVRVNGQLVGTAWHAPWRLDIGDAVKAGTNNLEVRVANLWVNRLIGDQQPGAAKITYTALPTYRADAPLRPSGLIGPVTITPYGQ